MDHKLWERKHIFFVSLSILLTFGIVFGFSNTSFIGKTNKQEVRTVSYQNTLLIAESSLNEFDEHQLTPTEEGLELIAKKTFDSSIFENIDFVGLDENEESVTVRYEISYLEDESTVLMTVTIEGNDEIPLIETIPGLVTHNLALEADVMFVVDGEYLWLSDLNENGLLDQNGWFSSLIKFVTKAVTTVVTAVVSTIVAIVSPAIRLCTDIAVTLLGETAADIGAFVLNMAKDENGIYHARFDCWQQYFGYIDLYDAVFNAATSMRNAKFPFDVNGDNIDDYILWAWKGDYLNLGAGAELGIYKRWAFDDTIWTVDKNQAMKMTLKLDLNGTTLFDWQPIDKQWWITGFDWKHQHVNRDELTASYSVTFNDNMMYNAFKNEWDPIDNRWNFGSNNLFASFVF